MTAALFTLMGVVIGVVIRGAIEHRRWVREARLAAYSDFLEALDMTSDAARSYMFYANMAEKYAEDPDAMAILTKNLEDDWKQYTSAEELLRRRGARVELVASELLARTAVIARLYMQNLSAIHLRVFSAEESRNSRDIWDRGSDTRHRNRDNFIRLARADLRTDVSRRSVRGRIMGVLRRLSRGIRRSNNTT